jgi:hypothetical protein
LSVRANTRSHRMLPQHYGPTSYALLYVLERNRVTESVGSREPKPSKQRTLLHELQK